MTYSKFERNAAKKINQYASGVDGEALWAAVQPEIPSKGKRRGGFYWMLLTGLVLISVAAYLMIGNTPNPNPGTSELSVAAIPSENETPKIESNETAISNAIVNNPTENKEANQIKKAIDIASSDFKSKNDHSNSGTVVSNKSPKGNKKYKAVTTKTSESNPVVNTPDMETSTTTDPERPAKGNEKNPESSTLGSVVFSEEHEEELAASAIDSKNENVPKIEEESTSDDTETVIDMEEAITDIVGEKDEILKKDDLVPPSRNLGLTFGFGLYGGVSRSTADLKSRGGDSTMYLQSRLNSEKQLETLQLGVEVIAQAENGVYFRTGVQYSRIARKFATDAERTILDTVPDGLVAIYINENTMDTIRVYGEVIRKTTTTFNKNTYNYFHLLDVPLLAGYTFKSDQWSLGVEAGAVFNISNKSKGEIFDVNGNFYDLKTDSNDWYKTNVGVSLMAGLSAAYQVDYNFQIYVSPTFRLGSVFSTDKNPLKQSHASLGVNAGVRYFLD